MDEAHTTAAQARKAAEIAFVRGAAAEPLPPPAIHSGAIGWLRANLLSTPLNLVLTVASALLLVWLLPPLIKFLLIDATWSGADREACIATAQRPEVGACWAFVHERFAYFVYGFYPIAQRWRVDIFFAMLIVGIVWLAWLRAPRRDVGAVYFFVVMPVVSYILLLGWPAIGLSKVETTYWGGVLVTIVVAAVGIVVSLPIGVLLALGRRARGAAHYRAIHGERDAAAIRAGFLVAGQIAARAGRRRLVHIRLYGGGGARRSAGDPARAI
jgi:general L-amino acid transport system permease protein